MSCGIKKILPPLVLSRVMHCNPAAENWYFDQGLRWRITTVPTQYVLPYVGLFFRFVQVSSVPSSRVATGRDWDQHVLDDGM
jgi:hypothetical protein